jgi:hypothetical protein
VGESERGLRYFGRTVAGGEMEDGRVAELGSGASAEQAPHDLDLVVQGRVGQRRRVSPVFAHHIANR